MTADRVFVTNSVMGAVPAVSLDNVRLGYDSVLCDELTRAVFDEDPRPRPAAVTPGPRRVTASAGRGSAGLR
jgi:hypothetical protein